MSSNTAQLPWLDAFFIANPDVCYLDGNSLGRLPLAAQKRVDSLLVDGWGKQLIGGWNADWIHLPGRIGAKIAQVVGAESPEVIVADSTSVNLFKLATAALRLRPDRHSIVTSATNFPSDLYILESAVRACGGRLELHAVGSPNDVSISAEQLVGALNSDTALVCLSHVDFRSGYLHDMHSITQAAHAAGALVLWDLSHSVGAVPIALNDCDVDLAVGCTYKYLCGGPGAPAFLYVRESLQRKLENPIAGWFSHQRPFEFSTEYQPRDSIDRFLTGTPPVLSLAAIEAGVNLVSKVGLDRLRARSIQLTSRLIDLFDHQLLGLGFELRTPRDPARRGSHVSIAHPEARRITQCLIEHHQVIPDFRQPDSIRLGVAPLYTTDAEILRSIEALAKIVTDRQFEQIELADAPVT